MRKIFSVVAMFSTAILFGQKDASVSFEQWISLKGVGSPVISPDGKIIVYTTTTTDWSENVYDSELWMAKENEAPVQLTRTSKGSSGNAAFTPDGKFISFIADRGNKRQIYLISVQGGEALQLTKDDDGINSYVWSPDGTKIVYSKTQPKSKKDKTKEERYGAFGIEGEEYQLTHLWILNFNYDSVLLAGQLPCYTPKDSTKKSDCVSLPVAKALTEGNFNVGGFSWSPDGKQIAFNRQNDPLINSGITSDIVLIDPATKKMTAVISNPVGDFFTVWSPDGKAFVYSSLIDDSISNFYKNNRLFIYDLATKSSSEIAKDIDENKSVVDWNKYGLFVGAFNKTRSRFYSVNVKTGAIQNIPLSIDLPGGIVFSKNSDVVAASGRSYNGLSEIYSWKWGTALKAIAITNNTAQIKDWATPVNEVVQWKSRDGAEIEGILLKPKNFDAKKKYPLLVVIHGGPTGIDLPDPVPTYVYPIMQWVEKGALVLRVNYRGSAGYGAKFRALNVRNLGVGDMWDVVSGVEYLASKNMIDTSRMGCMGWSQGGYISAFLTTNTNMFKAISVGAGISNWVTYYVNTDITPFTRQYLQATPWNDMDIYLKTSPMTNINKASTPTLIQHGEFDKRVPIPNAYELYRGLQDRKIPSRLIVYKGFGHGINKPKERLAAVWHNWQWFNQYVFGEKEETMALDDKF